MQFIVTMSGRNSSMSRRRVVNNLVIAYSMQQRRYRHLFNNVSVTFVKKTVYSLLQEVLHTISAPSGQVQRIVIFKKNGVQAMVEYPFAIHVLRPLDESRISSPGVRSLAKRDKTGLKLERISTFVAHFLPFPFSFFNLERIRDGEVCRSRALQYEMKIYYKENSRVRTRGLLDLAVVVRHSL